MIKHILSAWFPKLPVTIKLLTRIQYNAFLMALARTN
jgi:hypothetical protein